MWDDVRMSVEEAWLVLSRNEELVASFVREVDFIAALAAGEMESRLVFTTNGPEGSFPVCRVILRGESLAWLAIVLSDDEYEACWALKEAA